MTQGKPIIGVEEEEDYLTCGKCMTEFRLDKITSFIKHKKQDCQEPGEENTTGYNAGLVCSSCPQGFMTAVGLLKHAQTIHKFKLFLEKSVNASGIGNIRSDNEEQMTLQSSLIGQFDKSQGSSDTPLIYDLSSNNRRSSALLGSNGFFAPNSNSTIISETSTENKNAEIFRNVPINVAQIKKADTNKVLVDSRKLDNSQSNALMIDTLPFDTDKQRVDEAVEVLCQLQSDNGKPDSDNIPSTAVSEKMLTQSFMSDKTKHLSPLMLTSVMKSGVIFPVMSKQQSDNLSTHKNSLTKTQDNKQLNPQSTVVPVNPQLTSLLTGSDKDNFKTLLVSDISEDKTVPDKMSPTSSLEVSKSEMTSVVKIPVMSLPINNLIMSEKLPKSMNTFLQPSFEVDNPSDISENQDHNGYNQACSEVANTCSIPEKLEATNSNVISSIADDNTSFENGKISCCDNQKCGVTVIPGTHEGLKKCCNAVVPKKRKRHFETKHNLLSRSKLNRRLCGSDLNRTYRNVENSRRNSGTIFIDLEPNEDGTLSQKSKTSLLKAPSDISEIGFQVSGLRRDGNNSSQTKSSGKGSVILQPGAVFSIPIAYSLSTQTDGSIRPLVISKRTFQSQPLPVTTGENTNGEKDNGVQETKHSITVQGNDNQTTVLNSLPSLITTEMACEDQSMELMSCNDGNQSRRRRYPTSRPFKCDKCDSAFNQRIHLKKHMSKHTGVKPFKCQQCSYSTVERSHLKVHIRIHTGEKPFKCTYCEYATAQNSTLKIHLKRHHRPSQGSGNKNTSS